MPRRYRPREVIRVLESMGWLQVRQESSHVTLQLPDGRNPVTVSLSRREVPPGTLSRIIRQAGLTSREFHRQALEIL
ncbi:MAG: type II toxin-antitoxin system HicA family toxin [Chloroflexi bacterium]|nr:type II toxin-antitoxin system HicA family toxin [Chloroflexota bacterium]MYE38681.1 type II toxin-antitoxin system HicA family toxin [Chloroflexota bacterium]